MNTKDIEIDLRASRDSGRVVEMTKAEARKLVDINDDDELITALDEAQGDVENRGAQYVILKIV